MISEKEIFEEYARHAVSFLLGLPLKTLVNSDRPDLQCEPYQVGFEVTRAVSKTQAITEKEMIRQHPFGLFRPDVLWPEGRGVYISDPKIHPSPDEHAYLVTCLKDKSDKFSGYTHFDLNGLYCFVPSEQLEHPGELIAHCISTPFDTVIFDCITSVFIWQRHRSGLSRRALDCRLRRRWSRRSRRLIQLSTLPLFNLNKKTSG